MTGFFLRIVTATLALFLVVRIIKAIFYDTPSTYEEFLHEKAKLKCGTCHYCGMLESDGVFCDYRGQHFRNLSGIDKCRDYLKKTSWE